MDEDVAGPCQKVNNFNTDRFLRGTRVKQALKRAGADKEYIDEYLSEATSGDYDHLLVVSMGYVDVE